MRLGTCRKSGNFFVPDMHPLDLPLPAHRVSQAVQAIADSAVDALDTN
jgi:hypothetical protein